ncbi:FecR family protein [Sphingomonas asaccharolytica]|uniref:FecR family protein n=1 Tax=Sphingomonas asaccharolytica TaxID=40681 RepID=UPI000834D2B6|nr:FecR domain-containing protein [Sphingomonas asaccharolytica]
MRAKQSDIIDQAICWHLRLAGSDEHGWADFIAWLEASPAHAAAYDAIAKDDRLIGQERFPAPVPSAGNDNIPAHRRRPWLIAGIAAAAIGVAMLAPSLITPLSSPYVVATKAGERRTVALQQGTSIELSGGTVLRLDRADPRVATLDRGEALFHVSHDAAHPFTMTVGSMTIRDLGTVFNVARDGNRLTISVAEGSVLVQPGSIGKRLGPGDSLSARDDGGDIVGTRIASNLVGGWRTGTLSFANQKVGDVVAALRRLYGFKLDLDGGLSERPFTGMVRFTGVADRDVPHLAEMIGATWQRDGERWILSDGTSGPR